MLLIPSISCENKNRKLRNNTPCCTDIHPFFTTQFLLLQNNGQYQITKYDFNISSYIKYMGSTQTCIDRQTERLSNAYIVNFVCRGKIIKASTNIGQTTNYCHKYSIVGIQ